MNIYDWNRLLWEIVESRLYTPGFRLYLAFDESLLEEELRNRGKEIPSEGPTESLNRTIRQHRELLRSGVVGLSKEPNGRCWRNNWNWVFARDEDGRSLVMVFAVQQILAAEHMRTVSFYRAYWRMLGLTADEMRINPFGDGGKTSFERLWARLKIELKTQLGVDDTEITFTQGSGSNKYRNLPVSQSLLSEGDLLAAKSVIPIARLSSDDRLYAALRRAKLSASGQRKVYIASLKEKLVAQVREFIESRSRTPPKASQPLKRNYRSRVDVSDLALYEEVEFFGETVFHCYSADESTDVAAVIDQYLAGHRCLIFEETSSEILSKSSQVLSSIDGQVFVLTRHERASSLLKVESKTGKIPPLAESFSSVPSTLGEQFVLFRCFSLPIALHGIDLSTELHQRISEDVDERPAVRFQGGICVNRASTTYVIGYGPTEIIVNDTIVDPNEKCELDAEPMDVGAALAKLSQSSFPCRFKLRLRNQDIYVNIEDQREFERQPTYVRNDVCLLPITFYDKEIDKSAEPLGHPGDVLSGGWAHERKQLLKRVCGLLFRSKSRWIKADERAVDASSVLMSYSTFPKASVDVMTKKMESTNLVPWPLYDYYKNRQRYRTEN